jgi:hypothetical protein
VQLRRSCVAAATACSFQRGKAVRHLAAAGRRRDNVSSSRCWGASRR